MTKMNWRTVASVSLLVGIAVVGTACSEASEAADDLSSAAGLSAKRVVGPAGGTIEAAGAKLEIPAGALDEDVEITIQAAVVPPKLPDFTSASFAGIASLGASVAVLPHGLTLKKPATLTLPVDTSILPSSLRDAINAVASGAAPQPGADDAGLSETTRLVNRLRFGRLATPSSDWEAVTTPVRVAAGGQLQLDIQGFSYYQPQIQAAPSEAACKTSKENLESCYCQKTEAIPSWSFDEEKGIWVQTGNVYFNPATGNYEESDKPFTSAYLDCGSEATCVGNWPLTNEQEPARCECKKTCHADASCTKSGDVVKCVCNAGFEGDGETCTASDPCASCKGAATCDKTCDDGDACTENDKCGTDGSCAGVAKVCDDSNQCTDDKCEAGNCTSTNNTASCDDGNACTDDKCADGACKGTPNTASCDDGDGCTDSDVCKDGACAGTAKACDDSNPCTDN